MIDDISVVVVQIDFSEVFGSIEKEQRHGVVMDSLVSIPGNGKKIAVRGDPVRGSFVPAREVARRRIDPKRGSYVTENRKSDDYEPDLSEIPYTYANYNRINNRDGV